MGHASTSNLPHAPGGGGVRLGRVGGVQLVAHWSLLVVFGLVLVSLGGGTLRYWHPEWPAALQWSLALAASILFFVSIALHELAHAWVGRRVGLPIDRVTLFVFGGMSHPRHFPPTPRAELLMAVAGPATSAILGVVATVAASLLLRRSGVAAGEDASTMLAAAGPGATLLLWLGPVNLLLALFNLLPGFPLDGGRVLRSILWATTGNLKKATRWAAAAGSALGWLLVALGVLMSFGFRIVPLGGGPVSGLWLMLIGWFLHIAARSSYQNVLLRETLADVPVGQVMRSDVISVDPGLHVDQLLGGYFMRIDQRAFPVISNGMLVGLVGLDDVRHAPRDHWAVTTAADVMTPIDKLEVLAPEESAFEALVRMGRRGVNQLPVVDRSGVLRGMVARQDLLKWMWLASAEED